MEAMLIETVAAAKSAEIAGAEAARSMSSEIGSAALKEGVIPTEATMETMHDINISKLEHSLNDGLNVNPEVSTIDTINSNLEGTSHPEPGISFERTFFEHDGIIKEGVFPDFSKDVKFECELDESDFVKTRGSHFDKCNEMLNTEINKNPEWAKSQFSDRELMQIADRETPDGYTWHHNQEPGKMQLVPENIHAGTGHTGGFSIWGQGQLAA